MVIRAEHEIKQNHAEHENGNCSSQNRAEHEVRQNRAEPKLGKIRQNHPEHKNGNCCLKSLI